MLPIEEKSNIQDGNNTPNDNAKTDGVNLYVISTDGPSMNDDSITKDGVK